MKVCYNINEDFKITPVAVIKAENMFVIDSTVNTNYTVEQL